MKSTVHVVWQYIRLILIAVVIALFVDTIVAINSNIPSESMEPTIMTNDRIFSNRLVYYFDNPKRMDVVIFNAPDSPSQLYVKRVIGMPGEVVEIKNGMVYINQSDIALNEPYLNERMIGNFGPYVVPEGHYFVMGDNRNHSFDSRYWENTYVPETSIKAKAMFRYYPKWKWIQ